MAPSSGGSAFGGTLFGRASRVAGVVAAIIVLALIAATVWVMRPDEEQRHLTVDRWRPLRTAGARVRRRPGHGGRRPPRHGPVGGAARAGRDLPVARRPVRGAWARGRE